jgi:ribosomal protein S28E/S33
LNNSTPKSLEPIELAEVTTLLGRIGEGNDGETYKAELLDGQGRTVTGYVKLTLDPRKIIAELVTAQVARALGLRVPKPFLVLLDTQDLRPEFNSAFAASGQAQLQLGTGFTQA